MTKFFLTILTLLISIPAFVQNFTIDGIIEDYPGQKIYLSAFYGDQSRLIDSTLTNDKGNFVFSIPSETATGLYRIMLNGREYFDIILNKENVKLISRRENLVQNMSIPESEENKLYYDYLKLRNRTYMKLDLLRPLTSYYPRDEKFFKQIVEEFDSTQSKYYDYLDSLRNNQPEMFATRIALMEKTPPVNPFWSTFEEKIYMRAHFFDNTDFTDTALIRSNAISGKIIGYLSLYQNQNLSKEQLESSFIKAVDTIIKYTSVEPLIYEFALDYLITGFEQYNFNRVIEHIAENAKLEGNCAYDERSSELEKRIETLKLLSTGNEAPAFQTRDIYGKEVDLNKINSKYKLLVFWASWCPHCTRLIPELHQYYKKENPDMEVIAVSVDTSKTKYMNYITEEDLNWINIADYTGWDNDIAKLYGIHATPTLLLLDSNNRILAKPMRVSEIKALIE